jgi:hypothetical protein
VVPSEMDETSESRMLLLVLLEVIKLLLNEMELLGMLVVLSVKPVIVTSSIVVHHTVFSETPLDMSVVSDDLYFQLLYLRAALLAI